jgi:uncharacterized GH25 family protein/predicted RNA-binding protein
MCEASVYINRGGQNELLMEYVDRIVPGEDYSIFMENIFGERRIIRARIKEMELVHHRIILEEVKEVFANRQLELWLEPSTDHGHFHPGEEVNFNLYKGYNMCADNKARFYNPQAFLVNEGVVEEVEILDHHGTMEISLNQKIDGLVQVYVRELGERERYAITLVEVGHHHHHGMQPAGLPLEIVPGGYSHARLGENYEIRVLKEGHPFVGAEVRVTYSSNQNQDYPHLLTTDEEGRAKLFITARGNYLFSVSDDNIISTFTLIKSF